MNQQSGDRARVLVVEDEPLISMLLESMLEDAGYTVVATAPTLKAGLLAAADADIDLAILDMTLGRDSSFQIADTLQERGVPFLFASGHSGSVLPDAHAQRKVLAKPFDLADLESKLTEMGLGSRHV
jgi:DNA-binding response OmpR family regulator